MPTARELLEQADALMRRKQETAATRGPVPEAQRGPSTDSTFAPTHGPRTVEPTGGPLVAPVPQPPPAERSNETARPAPAAATLSTMRWSAPSVPLGTASTSPAFAPPPVRSPRTIQREPIAPSVARTALPVDPTEPPLFPPHGASAAPARALEPDIPTLTDAIDAAALAVPGTDDVPVLTEAIDPLADEPMLEDLDEPSVWSPTFGGATTVRVGAAPAVPVAPVQPIAGRDPLGLDRPPEGFVPAPEAQWSDEPKAPAPEPVAAAEPEPVVVEAEVAPPLAAVASEPAEASLVAEAPPAAPAPVMLAPLDDARVRAIAEEIGMQVLQRIDIFTDTELRARLGERLKPVVDRVSADLVAAINQHVGELLRAYVAEAIEREIDGWRDRQS